MRLAGLGKFHTILYDDRFDVYRTDSGYNGDGSTDIFYQQEPIYKDVHGRISFVSDDRGSDSETDRVPIKFDPKLFCASDVDIKAGDYVVIRRYSDDGRLIHTYRGTLSMPSWYSTHQETFVRVSEEA